MQAHRIETTVQPGGMLAVHGLPVPAGVAVEVIVLVKEDAKEDAPQTAYPLRGTPYRLDEPTEPAVNEEDWEVLR